MCDVKWEKLATIGQVRSHYSYKHKKQFQQIILSEKPIIPKRSLKLLITRWIMEENHSFSIVEEI